MKDELLWERLLREGAEHVARGRLAEGARALERALREAEAAGAPDAHLARALDPVGRALWPSHPGPAIPLLRRAVELYERCAPESEELLRAHSQLGYALFKQGEAAAAVTALGRAAALA